MEQLHNEIPEEVSWFDGKNINEVDFCRAFLQRKPMKYVDGALFNLDGQIPEVKIKKEIYDQISAYCPKNVSQRVNQILESLKLEAYAEEIPLHMDRIHVANGTYFMDGRFTEEKEYCRNRLAVPFHPEAKTPTLWFSFLQELLEDEDILTLQEYMGYCFIPSNKGQKMLLIKGKGGEGKSRIGLVMRDLLQSNVSFNNIQKIETDKFARADLQHKLLMVDDVIWICRH